ncbi:SbcCD C, AAA 23 and/or SMC N domain containing protein [Asbolus verrucosus]|uniref:DNA repair protein RAD50 n=1 Tax=Asbolus verrucosus TaxID=1661398 RepID=A0A482W0P7_ASBVE|nr:SbcCD C, AAA 23 and/or SMC N domain containing protein [Asbolus verrucosus]
MAKLMKLQISGIRSFGPYEDQTQQLKFASPLTLILGQNGCGKTTIIESIKYACSGELPGGTNSGQGFVNDPKMSRSVSTKGQIKLKILDTKGNEVTVCRIVEVVQNQNTMKFSSKSATIRIVNPEGHESSISSRCADITSECCQIMNVSPSVLNNVIFCHQENSIWPLDEGKKVKEKFDEIFDAQKYNRCSDIFRKQLKGMQDKIKVLKLELSYKQDKKRYVEKTKNILQEKEDKLQSLKNDVRRKNEELDPVKQRIEEIFELEKVLGDLERQLTTKEATKKGVMEEQNTIKRSIPFEFEGSDEELRDKIQSFETDRAKEENFIVELEKRKNDIDSKSKVIVRAIQEAQTQLGKLNQEKNQHQKKCSERKELLEKARDKMDVKNVSDCSNHENAKYALQEVKNAIQASQIELDVLIAAKETEEVNLQKVVDDARENSLRARHSIDSKEKQVRECEQKIAEITNTLTSLASSDDYLKNCAARIENIDKTMYSLTTTFKEAEESQKCDNYKRDIQDMERNVETLEAEYKTLQQNDIIEGKLDTEKRLIIEKQKEINRIKSKHFDNFQQLFAKTVPEKNLKDAVLTMQTKADLMVKNLTEKINTKQKEVTTLEVQRQHQTDKIATYEKELKTKQEKISQVCNGRNFNETLENSFQRKERLQMDKGQYSSVKVIFGQYIKEFEKDSPCCPICETNFRSRNDVVKKIIATLKTKLEAVPQKLATVENELEKEESIYTNLQQLKLVNDEIELLSAETLPQSRHRLEEIDQVLKENKAELEALKTQLKEPQKIVEISKNVISDVASLDQNQSDVEKSKRTVEILKEDLVKVDSNKSKQEVEAELDFMKSEISELRRKVDAQVKKINNHKDRLQQLTQERVVYVDKQMRMKEEVQGKSNLEKQKTEMTDKVTTLRDEIMELKATFNLMEAELQNAIENKENIVQKNKQHIQNERDKIAADKKIMQDIEKLQKEIEDYLNEEIDKKLSATEAKLNDCQNKEDTLAQTKTKIINTISDKKEDIAKQELRFQTLKNNVILREKKALEKELETEIQILKKRIGGYNYRSVYEEKRRLTLQRENLEKEINNLIGEKNGLMATVEELGRELAIPENKQAYTNYMIKLYELKITERIVDDLSKYVVALEKAILDFHRQKMIQINKNIRELWRDIYRGNDIDYIEIKTEHSSGSAMKRSYNYKVVQVKKGIELDMRGRCSAGQKILACLIIRMALAETLSTNCGILALDEPTTNLDRENIQSLSDTLSRIVNTRQREKSFQLLIITHDEEFLNTLTRVQGVSYYYRVCRDDEGFSVINKEYVL